MSERWVSQPRRFCKFCDCWFADNKISIQNHERGVTHQTNVDKALNQVRQNDQDRAAAEKAFMVEMQKIEAAAVRSLEDDAKRNSFARDEYERYLQAKNRVSARSNIR